MGVTECPVQVLLSSGGTLEEGCSPSSGTISGDEFFDRQEHPKDHATLTMQGTAPELNSSTMVVNYLVHNPETKALPLHLAISCFLGELFQSEGNLENSLWAHLDV
jgi:hypothetical protein